MKLFTSKLAPNPLRVEYFFKEKNIWNEVEIIEIELSTEAKQEDYLQKNNFGLTPVLLRDDGKYISQSRAICSYIEALYPNPNLMGENAIERAEIEMYDRDVELELLMPIANWVRHSHPGLAKLEQPQISDWANSAQNKTHKALKIFDNRLGNFQYAAGNRFTIADITMFSAINFARLVKLKAWEEYNNINRWREEILTRPAFKA